MISHLKPFGLNFKSRSQLELIRRYFSDHVYLIGKAAVMITECDVVLKCFLVLNLESKSEWVVR